MLADFVVRRWPCVLVAGALLCSSVAHAGLAIRGSRVIYNAAEKETSVFFQNMNAYPVLVQAWLDDGDMRAEPGAQVHPFLLIPALDRVDPGKGQTIRILGTGTADFPQDRESVLWFNLHEMPPAPDGNVSNYMQIAGRARLKFFYRPAGLSTPPELAHEGLRFAIEPQGGDARTRIRINNASPYHVTVVGLQARRKGQPDAAVPLAEYDPNVDRIEGMVAPRDTLVLPLRGRALVPGMELMVETKNDYGAIVRGKVLLGHADAPLEVIVDPVAYTQ